VIPLQLMLAVVAGWVLSRQQETLEYLRAENRILKGALARATTAFDRS